MERQIRLPIGYRFRDVQVQPISCCANRKLLRSYRGPQKVYYAAVDLTGESKLQELKLSSEQFQTMDGTKLQSWEQIDVVSLRAYHEVGDKLIGSKQWQGEKPSFKKIYWESLKADGNK